MISCRADLFRKFNRHIYKVDLTIHFPQTNDDYGFARTPEGNYKANLFMGYASNWGTPNVPEKDNEVIMQKIENALGHPITYALCGEDGQTWLEFSKAAKEFCVSSLQPICEEPIVIETRRTGRYEYILHMKIGNQ